MKIMKQIVVTFSLLQKNHITHRDIKPQNILIKYNSQNSFIVKLADYGLSREFNNKSFSTHVGTPLYMAPELINAKDDVDIRAYNRILSNNLKFYKKYKCYKYGFRNLFYDFSKNIMLPPYLLFNHVKYLYYGISKKEARKFKGKGIVITNHISYSDGFVFIRRYYPEAPFTISVYEYYDNVPGFIRFYSRLSNVIRLTGAKAIGILLNALYANKKVAIFPEGKISSDGEIKDLQDGTAYLAIKGHAKIYPSITLNPYKAFHKQYVIFGKAIDPKEFFQNDFSVNKEDVKKLTKIIHQEMINLHNEGMKIINSYE